MDAADWDDRYRTDVMPFGSEPNLIVRDRLAAAEPGRAVDLACGDGRHARWLARRGWQVTGVDFSAVALDHARGADTGHAVEWVHADVTTWQPSGQVDLVLAAYLHLGVDDLVALLSRAATWLAPGGRLLYLGHARENHKRGVGGPPDVAILPDVADLARAAAGLHVVELNHQVRPTDRGAAIDVLLDARPWDLPVHGEPAAEDTDGSGVPH